MSDDPTRFLPGSMAREMRVTELGAESLHALALSELAAGVDRLWSARIALGELLDRGEPVRGKYDAAVRATVVADRALAKHTRVRRGATAS